MKEIRCEEIAQTYFNKVDGGEFVNDKIKEFYMNAIVSASNEGYFSVTTREVDLSALSREWDAECPIGERLELNNIWATVYKPVKFFGKVIRVDEKEELLVNNAEKRQHVFTDVVYWLHRLGYTIKDYGEDSDGRLKATIAWIDVNKVDYLADEK